MSVNLPYKETASSKLSTDEEDKENKTEGTENKTQQGDISTTVFQSK